MVYYILVERIANCVIIFTLTLREFMGELLCDKGYYYKIQVGIHVTMV